MQLQDRLHGGRGGDEVWRLASQQGGVLGLETEAAAQRPAQRDLVAEDRQQTVVVPRLFDEVAGAEPDRPNGDLDAAPGRHHHHRQRAVQTLELLQQLETLGSRRRVAGVVEVDEGGVKVRGGHRGERAVRRIGGLDRVPLGLEQEAQRLQHVGLIVGNQDSWGVV